MGNKFLKSNSNGNGNGWKKKCHYTSLVCFFSMVVTLSMRLVFLLHFFLASWGVKWSFAFTDFFFKALLTFLGIIVLFGCRAFLNKRFWVILCFAEIELVLGTLEDNEICLLSSSFNSNIDSSDEELEESSSELAFPISSNNDSKMFFEIFSKTFQERRIKKK